METGEPPVERRNDLRVEIRVRAVPELLARQFSRVVNGDHHVVRDAAPVGGAEVRPDERGLQPVEELRHWFELAVNRGEAVVHRREQVDAVIDSVVVERPRRGAFVRSVVPLVSL